MAADRPYLASRLRIAAGMGIVTVNRGLTRLGLRTRVDGWRRAAGLVLTEETASFVLSAFSLDAGVAASHAGGWNLEQLQTHIAERLGDFLADESELHVRILRGNLSDLAEHCGRSSYTLRFEPWIEGPARFVRPQVWGEAGAFNLPTSVLLNVVCRVHSDGRVDVWVRANHVGTDGMPLQDAMSRLEKAWGTRGQTIFPTADEFAGIGAPRKCVGTRDVVEVQTFFDFQPLLAWRKRQNEALGQTMTLAAAVVWWMGGHREFANLRVGTTVEIDATRGLRRGVGAVVIRPGDYFRRNDLAGYVRAFNRQVELTRERRSANCRALDAAGQLSPALATTLLHHVMIKDWAFGSLGLSMIKDAKIFGAPLGDVGHRDGFVAIGNINLNAGAGRRVGCMTAKGPVKKVSNYPRLFREVIELDAK